MPSPARLHREARARRDGGRALSAAPARILVADDDPAIRKALRIILSAYQVHEAADGGEALRELEAFHPDLVLSDLQMPAVAGLELLRRVKTADPTTAFIILTG